MGTWLTFQYPVLGDIEIITCYLHTSAYLRGVMIGRNIPILELSCESEPVAYFFCPFWLYISKIQEKKKQCNHWENWRESLWSLVNFFQTSFKYFEVLFCTQDLNWRGICFIIIIQSFINIFTNYNEIMYKKMKGKQCKEIKKNRNKKKSKRNIYIINVYAMCLSQERGGYCQWPISCTQFNSDFWKGNQTSIVNPRL